MPPAIALSFGAAVVALAWSGRQNAAPQAAMSAPTEPEVAEPPPPEVEEETDDSIPDPLVDAPATTPATPGFDLLPDGSPVPELPRGAPSSVKFGVILFEYEGAQAAPGQNNPRARTKAAARALAEQTLELARTDFAKAAEKGDRGSTANAGSIPRGVLEPNVEYLLFTLDKGSVYPEPIDTPRGFWIIRRIQ